MTEGTWSTRRQRGPKVTPSRHSVRHSVAGTRVNHNRRAPRVDREFGPRRAALCLFTISTVPVVLRKKHPLSDLRPLFMLQSFPACIHGADQQGRRWRQLADHKELCDLRFLALESLLGVLEFLDLGWNVGGLYCNEPPTL